MTRAPPSSSDYGAAARLLRARAPALAEKVTERQFAVVRSLEERYGAAGREACTRDVVRHLEQLAQAIESDSVALFIDYVGWAKVLLEKMRIPELDLAVNLATLEDVLSSELPLGLVALTTRFIGLARKQLESLPSDIASFLDPSRALGVLAGQYLDALLAGDRRLASRLILDSVAGGTAISRIYLDVFQRCQYEIGRLWQLNRISVAQEHFCTAATQLVMSQLYEGIFATEKRGLSLVATCATSDLHEVGIRMVSDFFEMDGWDTFYLGANTPVNAVIREVEERSADVLAVSVTLSTHLHYVRELVSAARAHPACERTKLLVGGYPFSLDGRLWQKVGADGSAHDALGAVDIANRLMADSQ